MIRPRAILLLTLAALGLMAGGGRADEGPIIIAHRDTHPFLTLDPFKGSVSVSGVYETDRSRSSGGSTSASDTLFTQELTLSSGGTIVSPNLFKWSGSFTAAAEEDSSRSDEGSASSVGFFDTYDLNLDLVSGTQFPVSAYASRSEGFVNRSFAGMLRNTITAYGASVQYRSPIAPSTLNVGQTTMTQSDLGGKIQYSVNQRNLDFSTAVQPGERHNLSLNYSYGTTSQNNPGALANSSQHQSVNVNHDWSIDPLAHYTLSQTFNYSQQEGTYSETRLRLGEQLRMRLLDNLDGGLTYTMEQQNYLASQVTSQFFSGSLTHRLFESLTTTARAGMSLTDSTYAGAGAAASSASNTNYYANIGTDYNKKVWLGHFGANLALGFTQGTSGAVSAMQQVLGDVQSFNDPQPIILTRTGVNAASIAVFDAAGTRRFTPGIDYTVNAVNNTVQIARLLGGNIAAGDTVRLNYGIDPLPAFTSQSVSLGTGANYSFEEGWLQGLNVYLRYYQVEQSISPRTSSIRPDSIRDTTLGADYRIWKVTLRAEDEMHSSQLAPYNSLRFNASYADNLSPRTSLTLNATQSFITVPTDHSTTASTAFDARLQYEIMRNLRATVSAQWRHDSFPGGGSATGIDQQVDLHWNIRQTDLYVLVRHSSLDAQDNRADTTVLQFGLSRGF